MGWGGSASHASELLLLSGEKQAAAKMLSVTNRRGNADEAHSEALPGTCHKPCY